MTWSALKFWAVVWFGRKMGIRRIAWPFFRTHHFRKIFTLFTGEDMSIKQQAKAGKLDFPRGGARRQTIPQNSRTKPSWSIPKSL